MTYYKKLFGTFNFAIHLPVVFFFALMSLVSSHPGKVVALATTTSIASTVLKVQKFSFLVYESNIRFNAYHSAPLFAMPWRRHGYTAYITFKMFWTRDHM